MWGELTQNRSNLLKQYRESHWIETSGEAPEQLRATCRQVELELLGQPNNLVRASLLACVLSRAQIEINPYEWLADKINHAQIMLDYRKRCKTEIDNGPLRDLLAETAAGIDSRAYSGNEDFSHTAPDWSRILQLGFPGILQRLVDTHQTRADAGDLSPEQDVFYTSCAIAWRAVIDYTRRLADACAHLAKRYPKQALVADCLDQLTRRAPATLMEALQVIILVYTVQNDVDAVYLRSLGGLDRLLLGFYRDDLASGRFSKEQLNELLQSFMIKLNAKNVGANIPFYLGGVDAAGQDVTNELSYLFVELYGELAIHDPKIQIRVHAQTPVDFLRAVLRCIRRGSNSFLFIQDEVVIPALTGIGISLEHARNYVPIGCYEPCALGKEIPCTCNGIINLPKAIELALNEGIDPDSGSRIGPATGPAESLTTFAHFLAAVKQQIDACIAHAMTRIIAYEKHYAQITLAPLYSATLDECVARGIDAYAGGALYNNSSINAIGLATAVDALIAVRQLVYTEQRLSLDALSQILRDNWTGHESLRRHIQNQYPKYGNGHAATDDLAADLAGYTCSLINNRPNGRGGVFRCGLFSINWYFDFGNKTGATPDGRLAGEPLSKNLSPVISRDKAGVTALIQSVTRIDNRLAPNGSVLDLTFHPSAVQGEAGLEAMHSLLSVYRQSGGMAIHFNILDAQTLRKAQKNPEQYANLQIRVCGWNAYFVHLSPTEQAEFIARAECR